MRIATASVRTGLAMTWFLHGVRCKSGRRGEGTPPYETIRSACGRAVGDAGPYGSTTGACGQVTARATPTECNKRC